MVTTTSSGGAVQPPPEAKGAKGEAKRKQSDAPIDRNVGEDPRLEIFRKEWFAGKDCLDIGCNQGLVTIGLGLIETAKWNLRTIARGGKVATKSAKVLNSSDSTTQSCPEVVVSEMSNGNISKHKQHDLFEIVSFRTDNFVQSTHRYSEQYDTIMCLSVTKWIHLNWGDDGIITLFVKIWSLLRPVARENFNDICIYPEKFREILLDKVGFRSVEVITDRLVGSVTGFDRPIEVYHK
ncbi:hypothetical protein ACQ4PT_031140 [Festuca glaucescens]